MYSFLFLFRFIKIFVVWLRIVIIIVIKVRDICIINNLLFCIFELGVGVGFCNILVGGRDWGLFSLVNIFVVVL